MEALRPETSRGIAAGTKVAIAGEREPRLGGPLAKGGPRTALGYVLFDHAETTALAHPLDQGFGQLPFGEGQFAKLANIGTLVFREAREYFQRGRGYGP